MDQKLYEQVEPKAEFLVQALPYIRDFNQKIVVIEYGCREHMRPIDEQEMMKDIALLRTVGMLPVVVHDTPMGVDKFRENKRIAKLIELCGVKAIGVCGIDLYTLGMTLDNGYVPVIVPNDIDNEADVIDSKDAALEVAKSLAADKLVFMSANRGIFMDKDSEEVYPRVTVDEVKKMIEEGNVPEELIPYLDRGFDAVGHGVNRVHILDGRIKHALLLEFFSVAGIGTILIQDQSKLYAHELGK